VKITTLSDGVSSADHLTKGLECLLDGIHILIMSGTNRVLASSFASTAGSSKLSGFARARERYTQADTHFAALLVSSKSDFHYDGSELVEYFRQIREDEGKPYNFAISVYDNEKSNQADYDMAYEMYQAYYSSVGHLKDILDKIRSGEIAVKWEPGTELPEANLPKLNLPQQLNRKYKAE